MRTHSRAGAGCNIPWVTPHHTHPFYSKFPPDDFGPKLLHSPVNERRFSHFGPLPAVSTQLVPFKAAANKTAWGTHAQTLTVSSCPSARIHPSSASETSHMRVTETLAQTKGKAMCQLPILN